MIGSKLGSTFSGTQFWVDRVAFFLLSFTIECECDNKNMHKPFDFIRWSKGKIDTKFRDGV